MVDQKRVMRGEMRRRLAGIGDDARAAASARIREALAREVRGIGARCVVWFAGLADEPSVWPPPEGLVGVRHGLMRVDWSSGTMTPCVVEDSARDVVRGRHGVGEPGAGCAAIPLGEVDAVVVPGLAFDERGGRLGRGGGFYDRLLGDSGLRAVRIGVCLEAQVVEAVPEGAHDARVDLIVTEQRVVRARG